MYSDIYCKDMELSDTLRALVHEKIGHLDHLLHDYPPDSVFSKVTLLRLPQEDEYYNVRVILELSGDTLYAQSNGAPLDGVLVNVVSELERQVQHLLSDRRQEDHWRRLRRSPETIRRTVPVDEDQLPEIGKEVHERTEKQGPQERHRAA